MWPIHWSARAPEQLANASKFVEFRKEIDQSIPGRFAQQVRKHPESTAIKTKKYTWTYSDLSREANRVAHAILTSRESDGNQIALLFEHDAPMVAGILGALKAGKTYVPLEPTYPRERLAHILADAEAALILTEPRHLAFARELADEKLRVVNTEEMDSFEDGSISGIAVAPDAVAYILYTSGSAGSPKGVFQNHRNVLHHIRCYTNALHISAGDRMTLLSSYSFDAAVMDLFGALLNGATLFPIDLKYEGLHALPGCLERDGITIYHSTPTVYRWLVNNLTGAEDFPQMRLVVLGGEEVCPEDFELYRRHFPPQCRFVNGLGPTESTLALQYLADQDTQITGASVPVGYPVEDTEVLLLDEAREPVAADAVGEIAIRSAHLALGYWQKPELTRAAFLPDPEGGRRRIYCTGDLGRMLPDGSIVFVGRKDSQVKIRGHRIELPEIEAKLREHSAIKEAVVVVVANDRVGEKRLVTYVVAKREPVPTASELRRHLQQTLPEFMVPSAFIMLDALPLMPNGKLDRRALPAPDLRGLERERSFVAPRSPVEQVLAAIWAEILQLDRVSIHDNFFDLGGHSLLAMQMLSRVSATFGEDVSLRKLFGEPSVAGVAAMLLQAPERRTTIERTAQLLLRVAHLSEEEVETMLHQRGLLGSME